MGVAFRLDEGTCLLLNEDERARAVDVFRMPIVAVGIQVLLAVDGVEGCCRRRHEGARWILQPEVTVSLSGASTASTIVICALRALATPCGGKTILSKVALTS